MKKLNPVKSLFVLFFLSFDLQAAHYQLFKAGKVGSYSKGYDEMIAAIVPGDTVEFSNGKVFTVYQKFQSGQLNAILDIGNNRVIRVKKMTPSMNPFNIFFNPAKALASIDSLREFAEGYAPLKKYGVKIPEVFLDESVISEYIVIEKIPLDFSYNQFMSQEFAGGLSDEIKDKAMKDLVDFAKSTYGFSIIGDFRSDQIHYSLEKGWFLVDWTSEHTLALNFNDYTTSNVFTMDYIDNMMNMESRSGVITKSMIMKPKLPAEIEEEALKEIQKERINYIKNYNNPPINSAEPEKKCQGFFRKLMRLFTND